MGETDELLVGCFSCGKGYNIKKNKQCNNCKKQMSEKEIKNNRRESK